MGEIMKTLSILMAVLFLFCPVLAADHVQKVDSPSSAKGARKSPAHELSPMMLEIQASMEAVRLEVAELKLRYEAAVNGDEAREIMLEATRVKKEGRIEIMRIQLRHARLNGDDELVAELEEIVTKMTAPPAKGEPVPRTENHQ
jgi:hypothetical protein